MNEYEQKLEVMKDNIRRQVEEYNSIAIDKDKISEHRMIFSTENLAPASLDIERDFYRLHEASLKYGGAGNVLRNNLSKMIYDYYNFTLDRDDLDISRFSIKRMDSMYRHIRGSDKELELLKSLLEREDYNFSIANISIKDIDNFNKIILKFNKAELLLSFLDYGLDIEYTYNINITEVFGFPSIKGYKITYLKNKESSDMVEIEYTRDKQMVKSSV